VDFYIFGLDFCCFLTADFTALPIFLLILPRQRGNLKKYRKWLDFARSGENAFVSQPFPKEENAVS
jgi:hypothetical protein